MSKPASSAREHYQREKARRAKRAQPHNDLMDAARREYQALLDAQTVKGKGGRPKKKKPAPAKPADEFDLDDEAGADE